MFIKPETPLFNALNACGVNPAKIEIEWDELCREDVLTISGESSDFTDTMLFRLAELYLTFPSRFVFRSPGLQARFDASVGTTPQMEQAMVEMAENRERLLAEHGLSDFAVFAPDRETLANFSMRAEAACGFEPGTVLSVSGEQMILLSPNEPTELRVLISVILQRATSVQLSLAVG